MNIGSTTNQVTAFMGNPFFKLLAKQRDLIVVAAVVSMLLVMVVPLPTFLLDMLLSMDLCLALIILLVTMYNREALEFTVFPSLLLVVTLFRLSLNIAATRLILGQGYAGHVVEVFGTFVTAGNPVVGFIIFVIIMVVQFIVITKGAGRIAEVAARFTLDAMPGKQMAIDADLNSGLINEEQARNRREKISREADFYGAMDGASKFVRGDAVAAIIITIINIIGGFIVGIWQQGLSFQDSLLTFTRLTIGDGLVTQIPALMISTGTGMLVSRAASMSNLGEEISGQIFSYPKTLAITSLVMFCFAFIPGFNKIPFILLAVGAAAMAYAGHIRKKEEMRKAVEPKPAVKGEEKIEDYLHVDPMELEIGYGLIALVDVKQGGDLLDRITMVRRQVAGELGIVIPPIRIRDNIQLKPNEYRLKIRTIIVGKGELMSGAYLAMDPGTVVKKIRGIETVEPAFGLPALWITESQKEAADIAGYTVVELPAVLATHLTEIVKRHAHQLLSRQDVKNLLDTVKESNTAVIDELIPAMLSLGDVHKILQNLLRERVSVRDLSHILETLADVAPKNKNSEVLTEYARNGLAAQICAVYRDDSATIPVLTIDPNLEARLEGSLQETETGFRLALSPGEVGRVLEKIGARIDTVKAKSELPIIICSPTIRSQLKKLTESNYPDLVVLSYNEIVPGVEIRSSGMISME
ncbi:MAG TPA: flagellar biosynthesis protein FlhA [Chitinivibrionales bacterium]